MSAGNIALQTSVCFKHMVKSILRGMGSWRQMQMRQVSLGVSSQCCMPPVFQHAALSAQ